MSYIQTGATEWGTDETSLVKSLTTAVTKTVAAVLPKKPAPAPTTPISPEAYVPAPVPYRAGISPMVLLALAGGAFFLLRRKK